MPIEIWRASMSHIDEGGLHAYLDGALDEYPGAEARRIRAHLERCASCTEALHAARMLRDDVHGILANPALDVTLPPLEELRRRADSIGHGAGQPPLGARMYRLGWAASVVLAVGIGWTLRGGQAQDPGGAVISMEGSTPTASSDRSSSVGDRVPLAGPAATELQGLASSSSGGPVSEGAASDATPTTTTAAPGQRVALSDVWPDAPRPSSEEIDVGAQVAAPAATRVAVVGEIGGVGTDATAGVAPALLAGGGVAPPARAQVDLPVREPGAGGMVPDAVGVSGGDVRERPSEGRGETGGGRDPGFRGTSPGSGAAVVSRAEAGAGVPGVGVLDATRRTQPRRPDGDEPGSLVVPGLEVLSIVWREEGVVPAGVRVLQRLESGEVLELIHLPEGFDPESVGIAEPGMVELVVPREQGWLILRTRGGPELLESLLIRLDAPPS